MKKFIIALLVFTLIANISFFPIIAEANLDSAINYLEGKNQNTWVSMALSAAGKKTNIDYLKDISGTSVTDYEAAALAILAVGENPRTFAKEDLIEKIKNFYSSGQIGESSVLNDDIFGILALSAQNDETSKVVTGGAIDFLVKNQNSDGGFSFMVSGSSDTNMTAMAAMALLSAGFSKDDAVISKAVNYLKKAQNEDGGFPYDPQSLWGTNSDASSDAWVLSLINFLGDNLEGWSKNGKNPKDHLLTLQDAGGFFKYQADSGEDSFSPVTTAYSIIALSGKWYPFLKSKTDFSVAYEVGYKFENSSSETICRGEIQAPNAMELVRLAAGSCGFTYIIENTSFGPYLKKINDDEAVGSKGWLYAVNFQTPNIGAADYKLQDGDYVIWHFGNFGWQPEGISAPLSAKISQNSGNNSGSDDEISFSVDVSSSESGIDFGEIGVGESKSAKIKLTNASLENLHLEAGVVGDALFRENLKIDSVLWRDFKVNLSSKESKESSVELQIPINYSGSGNKSGTLTFWAATQQ